MKKNDIIDKLQDMGILTQNAYPKSTFPYDGDIVVGLYEREMNSDFYFFNNYDKKIYVWKFNNEEKYSRDFSTDKFMIPLSECEVVWEDKPFVELPDKPYKEMTLREHACIELRVPDSGLPWLDELIKKSKPSVSSYSGGPRP